jgi:autotransporter-associated beta strand protein
MSRRTRVIGLSLGIGLALALGALPAKADPTWTGNVIGVNDWDNPGNWQDWTGLNPPPRLCFGPLSGGHASNWNNITPLTQFDGITFLPGAPYYHLLGNSITLKGDVVSGSGGGELIDLPLTITSTGRTFDMPTPNDFLSLPQSIDGNEELVKKGAGRLFLGGQNTYGGGTHIVAGEIVVVVNGALPYGDLSCNTGTLYVCSPVNVMLNRISGGDLSLEMEYGSRISVASITVNSLAISGHAPGCNAIAVPEPGTLILLGLAGLGIFAVRRWK